MTVKLYTVLDILAEEYGPIFQAKNDGVATRNYLNMFKDEHFNPSEYQLWNIGIYDTEAGCIEPLHSIVPLDIKEND